MALYSLRVVPTPKQAGQYDVHLSAEPTDGIEPDEDSSFMAACFLLHAAAARSRYGFAAFVGNVVQRVHDMKDADTEDADGSTERVVPGGQEQSSPGERPELDSSELDGNIHRG